MGESIASSPALEVSVSFGRFENDSLSWEKWSSFSPNKYLEEVEKCSTPGSVAQKKAYFEAHYKKIAARKAELVLEQEKAEKQMETNLLRSDYHSCKDCSGNTCGTDIELGGISNGHNSPKGIEEDSNLIGAMNITHVETDAEFGASNGQRSPRGIEHDTNSISFMNNTRAESDIKSDVSNSQSSPKGIEQETDSISTVNSTDCDALNEDASITVESQSSVLEGLAGENEINSIHDSLEVKKPEEIVLVQEDTHLKGSQDIVELPQKVDKEREINSENKEDTVKLGASIKSQKISPTKKEKNLVVVKKKLAPSLPKSTKISAPPRLSKPTTTSTVISTSRSSTKKSNNSLLPKSNHSTGESKRVAPMSLHMSLSLGPANSDSISLTTTRKSLIMEKMGDKDIVKRAFRTFQNNFNQLRSSSDERSSGTKQVPLTKGTEQKLSTSLTPRKENDGTRKSAEKINTERDQSGTRRNFMSSGSSKRAGVDQKKAKASPSSFGLRSDERADKRKEFLKKSEEKSSAKEAERAHLSSKSRDKDAEIKKVGQSLDFKATPLPGFYRGRGMSKSGLDKEGVRKPNHGRPETHR